MSLTISSHPFSPHREELILKRKAEERQELKKQVKKASDSLKAAMAEQDELEAELVVLAAARKADASRAKDSVKEGDHLEEMYAVFEKALELCDSDEAKEALHARLEEAEGAYAQLQEEYAHTHTRTPAHPTTSFHPPADGPRRRRR